MNADHTAPSAHAGLLARIGRIAIALALLVAMLPPVGYVGLSFMALREDIEGDATLVVNAVTRLLEADPELWKFATNLEAVMRSNVVHHDAHSVVLLDPSGAAIARSGDEPPWPALRATATIYDAGRVAGRAQVAVGMRGLLFPGGAIALALGLALGGAIYFALRLLPLRALRRSLQDLHGAHQAAEHEAETIRTLSELSQLMLSCRDLREACGAVPRLLERLLPRSSGRLYVLSASGNLLEWVCSWGTPSPAEEVIGSDDCWGLRRGSPHVVRDAGRDLACPHHGPRGAVQPCMCLPITAQNEGLGLLYVEPARHAPADAASLQVAETAAEQLALGLANLRMRRQLRDQSIRDALTGLHNRRFLEESAELDLERARRKQAPLSVLMIDVDHFKRYNDANGHEAGDQVLKALGALLRERVRGGDIACRYGGEEFTVLMPETPAAVAMQRAEALRQAARTMSIGSLPLVTISVGVATFPDSGDNWEAVLRAADSALYAAKREGRDRVRPSRPAAPVVPLPVSGQQVA